ncbi:MAG: tRNA 2-thiouridine(34) synthase MnmA, partial [Desulfobulbaceae bacterium]|nr:tRNA 2-thiouridine(34) synthase MnmA [Desulfobulbaceae bacterium]
MTQKKVAVAMSGGVDSSVTAALLKKQGYQVQGVFMTLAQPDIEDQVARVRAMADRLEIELSVIDLHQEFAGLVLDYFRDSYFRGLTPNPCVVCNRQVKFGLFMDRALDGGAEFLATGHYVRWQRDDDGLYHLLKGNDPAKDQSYFLCQLQQQQLARVRFPLGEYRKDEVYELAAELGLEFSRSEESQDVCFLKDQEVADFLGDSSAVADSSGPVVTVDDRVVGQHQGIHRFTVGQRRGLGIPDATPWYVVGLEAAGNRVVVGKQQDLFRSRLHVAELSWLAGYAPELPGKLEV